MRFELTNTRFLKIIFAALFLTLCSMVSTNAQSLKTQRIDLKGCIQTYREKSFVIKERAAFLKEIRTDMQREWCLKNLEKIDFDKHSLVGIELNTGYCKVPLLEPIQAVKSESEKQYLLKISYLEPNEPCRALSQYDLWLLVPKLPENYTVKFEVKGKSFRQSDQ